MCQLIGQTVIHIRSTSSTNNYAMAQMIDNELKEGTVFLAYEQTAGKGQMNNNWESEPGENLTLSIFLKPDFLEMHQQFMLSKAICLGIEAYLFRLVKEVKIKWPNDIYVADKKICGVLIENLIMNGTILQAIVGIGLNVNQKTFLSDAPNPSSLQILTKRKYRLDDVLNDLLQSIDFSYQRLKSGFHKEINAAFAQKLYQLNELKWYQDENHTYQGEIRGVNEIGQLIIQKEDGTLQAYHFKEVSYVHGESE